MIESNLPPDAILQRCLQPLAGHSLRAAREHRSSLGRSHLRGPEGRAVRRLGGPHGVHRPQCNR